MLKKKKETELGKFNWVDLCASCFGSLQRAGCILRWIKVEALLLRAINKQGKTRYTNLIISLTNKNFTRGYPTFSLILLASFFSLSQVIISLSFNYCFCRIVINPMFVWVKRGDEKGRILIKVRGRKEAFPLFSLRGGKVK